MRPSRRAREVRPFRAMAIAEEAAALEAQGHDVVRLNLGEPDEGAPVAVREAMREVMDGRPLTYTAAGGRPDLRRALAEHYARRHDVDVDPARVLVTSGASAALLLLVAATVEPGDDVLVADPSYPCTRELVAAFGGRVVDVPTSAAGRYQVTTASLSPAWTTATSAVVVASPANPTGTSVPPDELRAVLDLARERDAWRLVDEIYLETADHDEHGRPPRSVLAHDADALVVSSFSKSFGMTGWRLGWAVVPSTLVEPVTRLAANYFLSASAPAQLAALACFTPESLAEAERRRVDLLARRRLVLDGLVRAGLEVPVEPDGAFYVYVDVTSTGLDSEEFCSRALHEAHVALTPGTDFGRATARTHVRLSYASSAARLAEGLERLVRFRSTGP